MDVILALLTAHDCVPRYTTGPKSKLASLPRHEALLRRQFASPPKLVYAAYVASSFTYSFVGVLMLLLFNRRLPLQFVDSVPLGLDNFSTLLVVQGPFSFAADVWARTVRHRAHSAAYVLDRLLATSMTLATFYIGNVCWRLHSSPFQRGLAALSVFGLVPFALSLRALRGARYDAFMVWHIAWHVSIPLVAIVWLALTVARII